MNLVIERMGDHIRPFVMPILQLMPQLWAESEGSSLVRIQVRMSIVAAAAARLPVPIA